jgi:hypothetical protein
MLQDRVRNKLQVIAGATHGSADVFHALEEIAQSIDELGDVSLAKWEDGPGTSFKRRRTA